MNYYKFCSSSYFTRIPDNFEIVQVVKAHIKVKIAELNCLETGADMLYMCWCVVVIN